jgi:hypothetical protein
MEEWEQYQHQAAELLRELGFTLLKSMPGSPRQTEPYMRSMSLPVAPSRALMCSGLLSVNTGADAFLWGWCGSLDRLLSI